ncbi:MAG: type IV pilus twitching motility protein PilT [Thermoanaerobaculia bacterium]
MSLDLYLKETAKVGARELRLSAGRPMIVVSDAGEREVRNFPPLTVAMLRTLLAPVVPAELQSTLAEGRAEWTMRHDGIGEIRATAQIGRDAAHASFLLPAAAPARPTAVTRVENEIDRLFLKMIEMGASDLHLSSGVPPMVRKDGEMTAIPGAGAIQPEAMKRLLFSIAPERNRDEFERCNDTDFAYEIAGVSRFRANYFVDRKGPGAVFRVIPSRIITAEEMGIGKEILELCHLPKGLILVTGPTGSGKSTTLTALVDYMNRVRRDHIITIEDPIEFVHDSKGCLVNQRQVGEHTDGFKSALRAALREDPDVILVGEMRDLETISMAIETAETGHLVLGTLHTSSAATTVDRIIDQFPADRQAQVRTMLASSLRGVISQMLCRKIGGGRVPAMEVLIGTPSVSNLIREAKIFQIPSVMQTSRKVGMCLMNDSLLDLVRRGVVEPREALAKAVDRTAFAAMLKANGYDEALAAA